MIEQEPGVDILMDAVRTFTREHGQEVVDALLAHAAMVSAVFLYEHADDPDFVVQMVPKELFEMAVAAVHAREVVQFNRELGLL